MLTADINAKTLEEFYEQIRGQQEDPKNHGEGYCDHHDMIAEAMESCESYKELGTHQGASAASAMLAGAKEVHLVDHNHEKYNWCKDLFESYAECHGVDLNVHEMSSIDMRCAVPTDILMIDSLHEWHWTQKELKIHAPMTAKYIILHDTTVVNKRPSTIWPGLVEWCNKTKEGKNWLLVRREIRNVGSTMLRRK